MSRGNSRKYAEWEFRINGVTHKQVIRVSTSGALRLWATMPDGSTVEGTDCDVLRQELFAKFEAANKLTWDKVIVVVVSKTRGGVHFADTNDAAAKVSWVLRWRSRDTTGTIRWKECETTQQTSTYHGVYGDPDSVTKIIPWTQKSEDFMALVSAGINNLNTRIAQFFAHEECEAHILEMADASRLLSA